PERLFVADLMCVQKVPGLVLELIEVRTGRQLPLHDELPFALCLMSARAGRKKVRKLQRIVVRSGLSPFRGPVAPQAHEDRIAFREAKATAAQPLNSGSWNPDHGQYVKREDQELHGPGMSRQGVPPAERMNAMRSARSCGRRSFSSPSGI